MEYGCIGEHLKHSFSKEIHNALCDYEYEIKEIPREELRSFAEEGNFKAINVTIPYKEEIMPYLYNIDEHALLIGAVNTVVNRGGKLYGYNTDFYGMTELARHAGITLRGKKVVILGSGGTAKTSLAVCKSEGAKEIIKVSRSGKEGSVTYEELYESHTDAEIIINTTPVGMYPNIFDSPVRLEEFKELSGVIDAVYNPLRTPLIMKAREMGVPSEGGLYMLVAQAVRASEIFTDTRYPEGTVEAVYEKILRSKENIVLIGMPSSGKTTVGNILREKLGRTLIDTDEVIVKNAGVSIPELFKEHGEAYFRNLESEAVKSTSDKTCSVIATGGGAVLRYENIRALMENGRIFFIDRPLSKLIPTGDRPLSSTVEAVKKRYSERYEIYKSSCDVVIDADCTPDEVAEKICEEMKL